MNGLTASEKPNTFTLVRPDGLYLHQFNFTVTYRPGTKNLKAVALFPYACPITTNGDRESYPHRILLR